MKKFLLLAPFLLVLMGCATTPMASKGEMSLAEYKDRAARNAYYGICLRMELMDSNTYGRAIAIGDMAIAASGTQLDRGKLIDMTREIEGEFAQVWNEEMSALEPQQAAIKKKEYQDQMRYECQSLSGMANAYYEDIQEMNRNNSIRQSQNSSPTTICNKIGSQVICNTF